MPNPSVDPLVQMILDALPRSSGMDEAVADVRRTLELLRVVISEHDLHEAREIVARQHDVEILHTYSIFQHQPAWYLGPQTRDSHWPFLNAYFRSKPKWTSSAVQMLDDTSNQIVALLANPKRDHFLSRGLVVGHVQSGKTANMTAVIAKALDAGYNTVIVLSGMTDKLRSQTQSRLVADLVQRRPTLWQVLTPEQGDFRAPPHGGFLHHVDKAQIAIVKKNVSRLGELRRALEETLPVTLKKLRVLLIDDECDQASVNTARNELDITAINACIRELIHSFPAVSYVGYTATPFANVLINPYVDHGHQFVDDLYPRDFITALPKSPGYFGAEELFGSSPVDAANPTMEEEGVDMIRIIPDGDEERLQPSTRADIEDFQPQWAPSLEDAILYFLACCAVRRVWGDGDQHMTMLVHTSYSVKMHERLAGLIHNWIESRRDELFDRSSAVRRRFEAIWRSEQEKNPLGTKGRGQVGSEEVISQLRDVLEALEVPVENAQSGARMDYSGPPRTYIVVGGTILSRGLTLEGLMVSYFLRAANQYDTLLQMGRWFGYRPGYEDLPRIWTTSYLIQRFRDLASVESEIREDIDRYRLEQLTPMDTAVRIRAIPGMAITGSNKMRAARQCAISYWGTHKQTIRFNRQDEEEVAGNWQAGADLVAGAERSQSRDLGAKGKLWRRVPKRLVLEFVRSYATVHDYLKAGTLGLFLETDDPRLDYWNVGIVEPAHGDASDAPLGIAGRVALNVRSRLRDKNDLDHGKDPADIKALMSRIDVAFDCVGKGQKEDSWDNQKERRRRDVGDVPLLLLYAIDRESAPKTQVHRTALEAVSDVLGYGIVFPGSKTEGGNYVSVELSTLSADEIEDIEAEEFRQTEAAGV